MWLADSTLMSLVGQGAFELYGQPKWTFGKNTCNTYEVFAEVLHLPEGPTRTWCACFPTGFERNPWP